MAYVIDEKSIRITDRYANSYFIELNKISFMVFTKDKLDVYIDGHLLKLHKDDFVTADEVRRMYYSLLTSLSVPRPPSEPKVSNTTSYGTIPSGAIVRQLALPKHTIHQKHDNEKPEKDDNCLRASKPKHTS